MKALTMTLFGALALGAVAWVERTVGQGSVAAAFVCNFAATLAGVTLGWFVGDVVDG